MIKLKLQKTIADNGLGLDWYYTKDADSQKEAMD